ncbi:MAG: methylated-DNA--[protein]-cysteine S-methyltransferase [Anaerolineales bacterium]|nr:MAG: methylated-DNA--[protein]-cysteine S-methyltransferase [Anaerolineales bacterium]
MKSINTQYYKTPYGELILGSFEGQLCLCDWRYRKMRISIDKRLQKYLSTEYTEQNDAIISEAIVQIEEYSDHNRKVFDLPLLTAGTDFQKSVWNALLDIPYGSFVTYQKLAENLGNKNAVRAVAAANGANAISLFIPCHRVIGSDGEMVGYAGGLRTKAKLLELEKNFSNSES